MWNDFLKGALKALLNYLAVESGKIAINRSPEFFSSIKRWWTGRCISIIGATASGKNSFFNRLKNEDAPKNHIQTRGAENVGTFEFKHSLPNNTFIKFKCKNSINIGGEIDERERFWLQSCRGADAIFYLVDIEKFIKNTTETKKRLESDFKWLAEHISEFKYTSKIYILINKIDTIQDQNVEATLVPYVVNLGKLAKKILHVNFEKIGGIYPISMTNKYLFKKHFTIILSDIAKNRVLE